MDETTVGLYGILALWGVLDGAVAFAYQKINPPIKKIIDNWKENNYDFKTMYISAKNCTKHLKLQTLGPLTYLTKKSIKRRNLNALDKMLLED